MPNAPGAVFTVFLAEKYAKPNVTPRSAEPSPEAAFWLGPEHNLGLAADRAGAVARCDYKSADRAGGRMTSVSPMTVFA